MSSLDPTTWCAKTLKFSSSCTFCLSCPFQARVMTQNESVGSSGSFPLMWSGSAQGPRFPGPVEHRTRNGLPVPHNSNSLDSNDRQHALFSSCSLGFRTVLWTWSFSGLVGDESVCFDTFHLVLLQRVFVARAEFDVFCSFVHVVRLGFSVPCLFCVVSASPSTPRRYRVLPNGTERRSNSGHHRR